MLIFTAFSDTADYLYQHVSAFVQREFALNTAEITGTVDGKTTISYLSRLFRQRLVMVLEAENRQRLAIHQTRLIMTD